MAVDASLTLGEARAAYFAENGLPDDGGYDDRWVIVRVGPLPVFAFPNTQGRKRDVPFHDLHHVLTGYGTGLIGEAEIGAWELGSDCRMSPAAVVLNCQVFGFMLPLYPRRLFEAFMRGRRGRNLYGIPWDEAVLTRKVGEMREALDVDAPAREPTTEDRRAFCRWAVRSLATTWGPLIPMALIAWWIWG